MYFKISEGNKIVFKYDGVNMFTGYIFSISLTSDGYVFISAYDSLRYLKNKDTYVYSKITASQLIKMICDDYGLKTGEIDDTKYIIPYRVEDNKSLWDIILTALDITFSITGKEYILYDDCGKIYLKEKSKMILNLCADSDGSMIYYEYKTDIDNMYNRIKLFKVSQKTGERHSYVKTDTESRKKYGLLQYTKTIPMKYEKSLDTDLESLLSSLNKKKVTFRIKDLGHTSVRGGSGIYVNIKGEKESIQGVKTVESCTHFFENGLHTMELELI